MNTCTVCINLVTADEKFWEPEQIVMENQENCVAFEMVTNECNIWVVPYCNTFITEVAAIQLS